MIEVEYLESESIEILKSKIDHSASSTQLKRPRFLSENNTHPSYQVLNFQTLVLQNDYMSNTKTNKAETTRIPTKNLLLSEKERPSDTKLPSYQSKKFIFEKDKDTTSRKSTEIKSFFKSKHIDTSIEELSNNSYELNIEDDENENNSCSEVESENSSDININDILSKAKRLKDLLEH